MKRPLPLYFIVGWCLLVLCHLLFRFERLVAPLHERGTIRDDWWQGLSAGFTLLFAVALWHVVRLLVLKSFSLKLSIAVFACSTATLAWMACVLVPRTANPLRPVAGITIWAALKITCIWYLSRRSFREFAAQFVAGRRLRKSTSADGGVSPTNLQSGKQS